MAPAATLGHRGRSYGTKENIAAIVKADIRAYTALPDHEKRTSLFGRAAFAYDAERDLYVCPTAELLRRQGLDHREGSVRYAARPSACEACPLKSKCTKSANGRWVRRSLEEEHLGRVRGYRDTEPYRKALRKRAVWVEPLFAEAKDWHGLRRFRLRRLEKVNAEALMIAAGQNVKRLLLYGDRMPKKPAQVVALRPAAITYREPDRVRQHRCLRGSHGPATLFSTGCSLLGSPGPDVPWQEADHNVLWR